MGTFDWHSDVGELPHVGGPDGLAAFGMWVRCGTRTSANGRTGIVPDHIAADFSRGQSDLIEQLIAAGLWERTDGGYRMLRGPSTDADQPMPLWRYGDEDLGGRLFAIDDTPNT